MPSLSASDRPSYGDLALAELKACRATIRDQEMTPKYQTPRISPPCLLPKVERDRVVSVKYAVEDFVGCAS
jgi:hypothetical protein